MDNLSEDQVTEFREAFALFDRDGDGFITTKDLRSAINSIGIQPSEAEIQDMVNEIDMQGDGRITFIDFLNLIAKQIQETDAACQIKEALKVFDKDGRGYISVFHFRQVMRHIGGNITDVEIAEMIKEADPNKAGRIDYKQFVDKVMTR